MKLTEVVRDFLEYSRMFFCRVTECRIFQAPKKLRICGFGESGVKGRTHSISENLPISKEFFPTFVDSETHIFAD
jgi:hypothetical protein